MLVHIEQSECPGELRLLLQRRRWQDFHAPFFFFFFLHCAIPWMLLKIYLE